MTTTTKKAPRRARLRDPLPLADRARSGGARWRHWPAPASHPAPAVGESVLEVLGAGLLLFLFILVAVAAPAAGAR